VRKNQDLIGYCGLYCGDCSGYTQSIANLAKDLRKELRRYRIGDMAEMLAGIPIFKEFADYQKCYDALGAMAKMQCTKTCRGGGSSPDCEARICCKEKAIAGCWECGDFNTCRKLKFLEKHHGAAHLKNLRKLKKYGPAAFVTGKRYWYAAK
jgi:hypothetical protein